MQALPIGDPRDKQTVVGPIINKAELDSVLDKVRAARQDGADQLLGGEPTGPTGLVLPPHVLVGTNEVATSCQEVFGPVANIVKADGEDSALRIANDTELGLSSAVITRDLDPGGSASPCASEAGMCHVNDSPVKDDHHTAFGGEKASGLGRFGGDWVIDELTTDQWVSVQHERRHYPF